MNNSLIILQSIIQIFGFILGYMYTYNYSVPDIVAQSLVTLTVSIFIWLNSASNEDILSLDTAYARKQSMCCNTLSHWPTCRWSRPARSLAYCLDTSFAYSADCRQCTLTCSILLTIHPVWPSIVIKLLTNVQESSQM